MASLVSRLFFRKNFDHISTILLRLWTVLDVINVDFGENCR